MTLRGPADADHYRVAVGRYRDRWYADPLPTDPIAEATDGQWPSVSTVKKGGNGQDWSFVALKRVAESLKFNPLQLDGLTYGEVYDRLKSINQRGLERAGARGTNVHTYFECGLRGMPIEAFDPNEPGAEYLPAVRAFFDQYQPELIAAEVVAINRNLNGVGYGGTGDAIIRIDGKVYWPDWKSRGEDSSHGAYPEEGAQVGAYALADYLIVEGETGPMRIAVPELDGGLIVSVKPDGCRIYPVDLKVAAEHWTALHLWWTARQHEREAIGKPWAPRKIKDSASVPTAMMARDADEVADATVSGGRGLDAAPGNSSPANGGSAAEVASPVVHAAVEPQAASAGDSLAAFPADRRNALLARYSRLSLDDQARFRRLAPPKYDLDAVEKALDSVDPFVAGMDDTRLNTSDNARAAGAREPRGAQPPSLPQPTDEGGPVDDAAFEALEQAFFNLSEKPRIWIHNVILEADQAGVPFRANKSIGRRTARRFELYRGLLTLAAADLADDELVRTLVATVLDEDSPFWPTLTLGHCVGSLGVNGATTFARLCNEAVKRPEVLDLRSRPAVA